MMVSIQEIKKLVSDGKSSLELLSILESRSSYLIDNPITLFGLLSWSSRFEAKENWLTKRTVVTYLQGLIHDEKEAEELLKSGEEARVFSHEGESYSWEDKLVGDSCAAFYIGAQLENLGEAIIAQMVYRAVKPEFTHILNLVLDPTALVSIIKALTKAQPHMAKITDSLITSTFISKLQERPDKDKWIDSIAEALWTQGFNVNIIHIAPVASALARLQSKNIDIWSRDVIENNRAGVELALAIKAAQWRDDINYFSEMEKMNASTLSPEQMASWVWNEGAGKTLYDRLITLSSHSHGQSYDSLVDIWHTWITRQGIATIWDIVQQIAKDMSANNGREDLATIIVNDSLYSAMFAKAKMTHSRIEQLEHASRWLRKEGKKHISGTLAKWAAYYYSRDLVNVGDEWEVDQSIEFSVPRHPNSSLTVSHIFAKFRGQTRFRLPSSDELRSSNVSIEGRELVRDQLPLDFLYADRLPPGLLSTWDGKAIEPLTIQEIRETPLYWRPKFVF